MLFPLALLLTLRNLDTPEDPRDLEERHLSLNLRRRLGLSSVVLKQIRSYEAAGGDVRAAEVASLFELVARRDDAPGIFAAAGRRIAFDAFGPGARVVLRFGWRLIPYGLRRILAWGHARRTARRLCPSTKVRLPKAVHGLAIERGLPVRATADRGGHGCEVVSGIIDESFRMYRAGADNIAHQLCEALGSDRCLWVVEWYKEADPEQADASTGEAAAD